MKRKIVKLCLLLAILLCSVLCFTSCDEDFTHYSGGYFYKIKNNEITITGCSTIAESLVIPDTIKGKPVVAIDGDIAAPLTKTVTIPDSVRYIGGLVFNDCMMLENVILGNGIREIGFHAFDDCEKLIYNEYEGGKYLGNEQNPYIALIDVASTEMGTFTLHPDTVVVAGNAIENCRQLQENTFPDKVLSLGDWALQYCTSLETVYIPASVEFIDSWTFEKCYSLKNIVVSPENTHYRSIDGSLFSYDGTHLLRYASGQKVSSYCVPEGTVTIGSRAFDCSDNIVEVIFPDSLEAIYSWAFDDCRGLERVVFGNGLKLIQTQAFISCKKIVEITLPDSLEEIQYSTFSGCTGLKKVTFGTGITHIEFGVFSGCSALEEVVFADPNGWTSYAGGWSSETVTMDVSDPKRNAEYFKGEYCEYLWNKK